MTRRPDWTRLARRPRRRLVNQDPPGRPILPSEFRPLTEIAREMGVSTREVRRRYFLTR